MSRKSGEHYIVKKQVLVAHGELNAIDKRLLTPLLSRLGFTSIEYIDEYAYEAKEQQLDELKNELARARRMLRGETSIEGFKFSELTSPDHFLVREHLEDIKSVSKIGGFVGRTFNYLVDALGDATRTGTIVTDESQPADYWGRHPTRKIFRDPQPLDGVVVKSREELGLPPYPGKLDDYGKSQLCGFYAVQVGSIVELAENISEESLSAARRGVLIVGQMLEQQFTEE